MREKIATRLKIQVTRLKTLITRLKIGGARPKTWVTIRLQKITMAPRKQQDGFNTEIQLRMFYLHHPD
jgi:hypothetical protein